MEFLEVAPTHLWTQVYTLHKYNAEYVENVSYTVDIGHIMVLD